MSKKKGNTQKDNKSMQEQLLEVREILGFKEEYKPEKVSESWGKKPNNQK